MIIMQNFMILFHEIIIFGVSKLLNTPSFFPALIQM